MINIVDRIPKRKKKRPTHIFSYNVNDASMSSLWKLTNAAAPIPRFKLPQPFSKYDFVVIRRRPWLVYSGTGECALNREAGLVFESS